jgi:hypothetical protein
MLNSKLSFQQSPLYQRFSQLCEAVEDTRCGARVINERIQRHLVRLAEHTSVAAAEPNPRMRETWVGYAKLSLTRLVGVLDVAALGKHIPAETISNLLELAQRLDCELDSVRGKTESPQPKDAVAPTSDESAPTLVVVDQPSGDVLLDLRELAGRDEKPPLQPAKLTIVPSD